MVTKKWRHAGYKNCPWYASELADGEKVLFYIACYADVIDTSGACYFQTNEAKPKKRAIATLYWGANRPHAIRIRHCAVIITILQSNEGCLNAKDQIGKKIGLDSTLVVTRGGGY